MQIANHNFLVTGGSSGLGAACVRMLAAAGAKVIIADVNDAAAENLIADLGPSLLGPSIRFVRTDVTD